MEPTGGVESYVSVTISAEISLVALRNGGGEAFAQRLRERLEDELKLILDAPWGRVGKAETHQAVAVARPDISESQSRDPMG
jgi:hypothetical protein